MKINEIREKSSSDLANLEAELKQELFKLRDIAKIKTVLRERELKGE